MVSLPVSRLEELQKHFRTHDRIKEYPAHSARVHSVGWNCSGTRLASGSFDKSVAVFSLEKDKLVCCIIIFWLITFLTVISKNIIIFRPKNIHIVDIVGQLINFVGMPQILTFWLLPVVIKVYEFGIQNLRSV